MGTKLAARFQTIVAHRETGQGTLEYIGMIAVAAMLVAGVVTAFGGGSSLSGVVTGAIAKITSIGGGAG